MKLPRNARIFRGQLDAAPFIGVFFLLVIFMLLASLVYTPGVLIHLPEAGELPGAPGPSLNVAVDKNGQFFFRNQLIDESSLKTRLREETANAPSPLTLIVQADKGVEYESLLRLMRIAREAGLKKTLLATLPPTFGSQSTQDRSP